MAKVKTSSASNFIKKPRKKRPGIHSKCRHSKLKGSRRYKKAYRGQGRV